MWLVGGPPQHRLENGVRCCDNVNRFIANTVRRGRMSKMSDTPEQWQAMRYVLVRDTLICDLDAAIIAPFGEYVEARHPQVKTVYGHARLAVPGSLGESGL